MQVRFARQTGRLEAVVAFYREGLGLPELGRFADHAGYSGVILDLPGTGAHLELIAGGDHPAPAPHPESLLVLYLGDAPAARAAAERSGGPIVEPANPYWRDRGLTVVDPDGFPVVLVAEAWSA